MPQHNSAPERPGEQTAEEKTRNGDWELSEGILVDANTSTLVKGRGV